MKPFERAALPAEAFDYRNLMAKFGVSEAEAKMLVEGMKLERVWMNDKYQVNVRDVPAIPGTWPAMIHLSIKRLDKEVIHDWRELQQIKNMLVGPEHEALELYPAESRLADSANQFHLWVLKDEHRFPFGYCERFVQGSEQAAAGGGKQRPFEEE